MKGLRLILLLTICFLAWQTGHSQQFENYLKPGMVLDLLHINTKAGTDREARLDFLNNVWAPAIREGLPGTVSIHVEGIDGERNEQHAKFSLFSSVAIRDKYFRGGDEDAIGMTEEAKQLWAEARAKGGVTQEKVRSFFEGYDSSNFNFWQIVSATDPRPSLAGLHGMEMDMHYLSPDQGTDHEKLEKQLNKKLRQFASADRQYLLLLSDRGTREGSYAIMELHKPGQSQKKAIMDSDLKLDASLFSTYRIW